MARCQFDCVKINDEVKIVWLIDINGSKSMTNDAEYVCESVHDVMPDYRIIYRDSLGNWDEMVHEHGHFVSFKPARDLALD